jgi:GNAT superfamily N-acetyltransferase/predicted nucleotidyltransferase
MEKFETRNQKIIDAVLAKEKILCPGAIALIGLYGSYQTGDSHPLSDLDLLILINDERGWKLGKAFIQEDLGVGHDIYCTDWESLRRDAAYDNPHISKLMDSRIVYCADEKYRNELERLRGQVRQELAAPFCEADYLKAENVLKDSRDCYAQAMFREELTEVRRLAGGVLYYAENAIAMLNKTYFRKSVRRRYEELSAMEKRPEKLCAMIEDVVAAASAAELKEQLTLLMKELTACFEEERQSFQPEKKQAEAGSLSGTYEEMFSNWHGKMRVAAETGDRHLAFMSLSSLNEMMTEIGSRVEIGLYDVPAVYEPDDLRKTAEGFDRILETYHQVYEKIGLRTEAYSDIDAFITAYKEAGSAESRTLNESDNLLRAGPADSAAIAELACALWPEHTHKELTEEYELLLTKENAAVFLYYKNDQPAAFAQCQLRYDYVEGTETTPVGYLEGIYVKAEERRKGIARKLLFACENWAKEHGCVEFASDCELSNIESQEFHQAVGFEEANRIVAYVRKI